MYIYIYIKQNKTLFHSKVLNQIRYVFDKYIKTLNTMLSFTVKYWNYDKHGY